MRPDFLLEHASLHGITRRERVELTAKAGAVGALAGLGFDAEGAFVSPVSSEDGGRKGPPRRFTDEMFDVEAVLNGAWDDTAFYGRGDQPGPCRRWRRRRLARRCARAQARPGRDRGPRDRPERQPHLAATYRITLGDLEAAMRWAGIKTIKRGDVIPIRTGWNQLLEPHDPTSPYEPDDPSHPGHPGHQKYLTSEPGIYLREARWLASHRPAIVGADNWAVEVAGTPLVESNVFPVHPELLTHFGIRIGEAIVTDRLAEDRVFEFVYIVTPQFALGATAGNTPPCALGQPRR